MGMFCTLTFLALLMPSLLCAGELLREDDPRTSPTPRQVGRNLYLYSTPKESTFWKCDSDGNEWRKDTYGTIWKKEAGADPFAKGSWEIDGFDRRQSTRIAQDSVMQFQLNRDGTVKTDSIRRTSWIATVVPTPSTLPSHLRKAELGSSSYKPANLQQERPKLIPTPPPALPK